MNGTVAPPSASFRTAPTEETGICGWRPANHSGNVIGAIAFRRAAGRSGGSAFRRERLDHEPAGGVAIDAVGGHAGSGVLEDAVRVAPAHVLLVRVLELDAERP